MDSLHDGGSSEAAGQASAQLAATQQLLEHNLASQLALLAPYCLLGALATCNCDEVSMHL